MSAIHDDVKQALADLREAGADLEKVAGHELVRLHNALRSALRAIQAAKIGGEVDVVEIRAGEGAIQDPLHPATAATESLIPAPEISAGVPEPEPVAPAEVEDAPAEPVAASEPEAKSTKRGRRQAV